MSKTVFIIDIDTSIADNEHRAHALHKECVNCLTTLGTEYRPSCPTCGGTDHRISQASWDKFLDPQLVAEDVPVAKAQDAIYKMRELGMEFHFITGRNSSLRKVTEKWLSEHFSWDSENEALIMRGPKDKSTPASVYKERALKQLIKDKKLENCRFIFMEDDPYVFRMYQQYGIVIRCPEGWEHWMPEAETGHEPAWSR